MIYWKSIVEYSNDLIEKGADDDLLHDNNLIYIDNNINIDTKAKLNPDKEMTSDNLYKKNSEIKTKLHTRD